LPSLLAARTRLAPAACSLGVVTMWKPLKRWHVLLALLVVVGALTVGLLSLPHGGRVTRANCERIKVGMTKTEVYAILGKPWDGSLLDSEGPSHGDQVETLRAFDAQDELPYSGPYWMGSDVGICVFFNIDGRVIHTELFMDADRPRSWLPARVWRRLRARYGW
jgi:hypothetical protein